MAASRAAIAARAAYLFKPATAVRVRFATNDPTPWPPEMPSGESAPSGAFIDYLLAATTSSPITLEILDAAGTLVRSYSSAQNSLDPHPYSDRARYNEVCKKTPTAPYCGLPLYWPGPPQALSDKAGSTDSRGISTSIPSRRKTPSRRGTTMPPAPCPVARSRS